MQVGPQHQPWCLQSEYCQRLLSKKKSEKNRRTCGWCPGASDPGAVTCSRLCRRMPEPQGSNCPRDGGVCQLVRKLWLREGGMRTSTHKRLWRSAVSHSCLGMGMCMATFIVRICKCRRLPTVPHLACILSPSFQASFLSAQPDTKYMDPWIREVGAERPCICFEGISQSPSNATSLSPTCAFGEVAAITVRAQRWGEGF
jgi:hypothetical protein